MHVPNFHPQTQGKIVAKLDNVFLQANGMAGYQYTIKNKDNNKLTQVNFHWQWNKKAKKYEQHQDGDAQGFNVFPLAKQHEGYNFDVDPTGKQAS